MNVSEYLSNFRLNIRKIPHFYLSKIFSISVVYTKNTEQMFGTRKNVGECIQCQRESSFPCKMDRSQGIRIDVFPWCSSSAAAQSRDYCAVTSVAAATTDGRLSLLVGRRRVLQNPAFRAGLARAAILPPAAATWGRMKVGHRTVLVLLSSSFRFRVAGISKNRGIFYFFHDL